MPRKKQPKDKKTSSYEQGSSQSSHSFSPNTFSVQSEEKSEQTNTNIQQQETTKIESAEQTIVPEASASTQSEERNTTMAFNTFEQTTQQYSQQMNKMVEINNLRIIKVISEKSASIALQKDNEFMNKNLELYNNAKNKLGQMVKMIQELEKDIFSLKDRIKTENNENRNTLVTNTIKKKKNIKMLEENFYPMFDYIFQDMNNNLSKMYDRENSLNDKSKFILNREINLNLPNLKNTLKKIDNNIYSKDNKVTKLLAYSQKLEREYYANKFFDSSANLEEIKYIQKNYEHEKAELIKSRNKLNNSLKYFQEYQQRYNKLYSSHQQTLEKSLSIKNRSNNPKIKPEQKEKLNKENSENIKHHNNIYAMLLVEDKKYEQNLKKREELVSECQKLIKATAKFNTEYEKLDVKIYNIKNLFDQVLALENEENLSEDEAFSNEEDDYLIEENLEDVTNKLETLNINYEESEQSFQLAGKSRKGKVISGKAKKRTIPKVKYDQEGKIHNAGTYEVSYLGIYRESPTAKLARVEFDRKMERETYEQILKENPYFQLDRTQTWYRFDLFASKNKDSLFAIETEKDSISTRIHPFEESIEYTRAALFTEPLAALERSKMKSIAVKDKTPFILKNIDGVELAVGDGWGFIKYSFAKGLIKDIKSQKRSTAPSLPKDASPNTQMLQWLPQNDNLIFELVESGIKQLSPTLKDGKLLQNMTNQDIYRTITTGKFPVKIGTTMPVLGNEIVFPPGIFPEEDKVALHRSPADTLNWTTGDVASQTPTSEFIGKMPALQYRWRGELMSEKLTLKGMLGVIPDENWPTDCQEDIVVCTEDLKVDTSWKQAADVKQAKQTEMQFKPTGDLYITQCFEPGSLIGVPPQMMKELSGDYDGDQVHALARSDSPILFQQIESQQNNKIANPKLEKSRTFPEQSVPSTASSNTQIFANRFAMSEQPAKTSENSPAKSNSPRMIAIKDGTHLVGIWSTIADLLSTVNPLRIERELWSEINNEIFDANIFLDSKDMSKYVGLAIKAGTDLAKTNIEATTFLDKKKLNSKQLLEEGIKLLKFLTKKRGLKSPHKKRNAEWIAKDVREGRRLGVVYNEERDAPNVRKGHYGNLYEIMLAMDLYLESNRAGENFFTYRGQLASKLQQQGLDKIKKARQTEISNSDAFVESLYEILGDLKQILQYIDQDNKYTRENGSIWMLLAIKEFHPAELRQNLDTKSSPPSAADLQTQYHDLLARIEEQWLKFTQNDTTNDQETKSVTPSVQQPSSVANGYEEVTNSSKKISTVTPQAVDPTTKQIYLTEDGKDYKSHSQNPLSLSSQYTVSTEARAELNNRRLNDAYVAPTGDCLYEAFIRMGVGYNNVQDFRNAVADYAEDQFDSNEVMRSDVQLNYGEDLEGFLRDIRTMGSWENYAGDITPTLIGMLLNVNIDVINVNRPNLITPAFAEGQAGRRYTLIRFNENHYLATIPIPQ